MTRVVFSQLVILHQAVSVITSLESQVRGELLTCVIVCVYEHVIIVMMMILMMTTMIYSVFCLFVCVVYAKSCFVLRSRENVYQSSSKI